MSECRPCVGCAGGRIFGFDSQQLILIEPSGASLAQPSFTSARTVYTVERNTMPVNSDDGLTSPVSFDSVVIINAGDNQTSSRGDETSHHEPQERDAVTEKRYRRKSLRRQLQSVIDELGNASKSKTLKEAKKIDALLHQSEVLMKLQEMDKEEANQTLQDEHAQLSEQHAADTQRIQGLESQITGLRAHRCEIKTVPDPEHAKIRQQCETLSAALKFLGGVSSHKEQTAIRAIQQLPADVASLVCDAVGINNREYRQYLQSYKTERDLLNVVERADPEADNPLLRFCRAALAVNHSRDVALQKSKRVDIHSVQEELIQRERQENADRQARLEFAWRRQMGLRSK